MDNLIEQVVKKNKTPAYYAKIVLIILVAVLVPTTLMTLAALQIITAYFIYIAVFLIPIAVYVSYILITSLDIEYEYTLLGSTFSVDKIIHKRKRKLIVKVELNDAKELVKYEDKILDDKKIHKVYFLANKDYDKENHVLFYRSEARGNCAIIFKPKEELLKYMNIYIDRNKRIGR